MSEHFEFALLAALLALGLLVALGSAILSWLQ